MSIITITRMAAKKTKSKIMSMDMKKRTKVWSNYQRRRFFDGNSFALLSSRQSSFAYRISVLVVIAAGSP
jgi:hypothetical protein